MSANWISGRHGFPHIWVPRTSFHELSLEIGSSLKSGVGGWFKIIGRKADGSNRSTVKLDWCKNLITNGGLERWGTSNPISRCSVGLGNTPPEPSNTSLENYFQETTSIIDESAGANSVEPYYAWRRITFRFQPPSSNTILREVGFGWSSGGRSLWSRSLTRDLVGNVIDIPWLSDEYLDVIYELRVFPFTEDTPYETTIDGITRTGTIRAALVTNSKYWNFYRGAQAVHLQEPKEYYDCFPVLYNGILGAIYENPTGSYYSACTVGQSDTLWYARDAYEPGSRKRTGSVRYGPDSANSLNGVSAILHKNTVGTYQFDINPPVAKIQDWSWTQNFETPVWDRLEQPLGLPVV